MDIARLDEIIAEFEPELQMPMRRLAIWSVVKKSLGIEIEKLDGIIAAFPSELHEPARALADFMAHQPKNLETCQSSEMHQAEA